MIKANKQLPARRRLVLALCTAGWLAAQALSPAHGQETAAPYPQVTDTQEADTAVPQATQTLRYRFRDLGTTYPLQLIGVDGINSLPLGLLEDSHVVSAKLHLRYTHSPALLEDLSHLKVSLDNRHVATIPISQSEAETQLERDIELPADWFQEFSYLNLQLIGHYTLGCEDPRHPSLWATVSPDSELIVEVTPRQSGNDLSRLPRPFFDGRMLTALELPFVFASQPDTAALEAAGVLSSWFGALANHRGARFPVLNGTLPESGNAIVLAGAATRLGTLELPPVSGPEVSIVDHPAHLGGKLLLIRGRDGQELKLAAQAVATGGQTLSGTKASITELALPTRKPYDAPRWLPSDRPVSFGELARAQDLATQGFWPNYQRVNFRLPPDLYSWRERTVPVDVLYRYTPRPSLTTKRELGLLSRLARHWEPGPAPHDSKIHVRLNGVYIEQLRIPNAAHATGPVGKLLQLHPNDQTLPAQARMELPMNYLLPESQLEFQFDYSYLSRGECMDVLIDSVHGRIDPSSTIDISGIPHFIALPNMTAFSKGGYPFTRLADLSETAVVLPDQPDAQESSAYLALLGHLGAATGYPATHVQVALASQKDTLRGKDILLISGRDARQTLGDWARRLPLDLGKAHAPAASERSFWDSLRELFSNQAKADATHELRAMPGTGPGTVLTGFESPLSGGRSVVVVSSTQPAYLAHAVDALQDPAMLRRIEGSSVSLHSDGVNILEEKPSYRVGSLGPVRDTLWFLQRNPLLMALIGGVSVLLLGLFLYLYFRSRARERLSIGQSTHS